MEPRTYPWIAVLTTCFNRKPTTLAALDALRGAAHDLSYRVYLVDDGSTDGTGDAVRDGYPEATVIAGDGSLFWNGGMRRAWQAALPDRPDYYLWLNDDLELLPDALTGLFAFQRTMEAEHGAKVISVGLVVDPETGASTYGGYRTAPGLSRLRFVRASDDGKPCDTMNGNCVLIPSCAIEDVGINSKHYAHSTGDVDYGLRARAAGYLIFQSPQAIGRTPYNAAIHVKRAKLTWASRDFILRHPKGLPVGEWLHFCRAHGGWLWPVNFVMRYAKIMRLGS